MIVKDIKLNEIIQRKIDFIKKDKYYQDNELENVGKGEIVAYTEIISDIENMNEQKFVEKYIRIWQRLEIRFEEERQQDSCDNKIEIEELSGYNNAIVIVLTLLNPRYQFADSLEIGLQLKSEKKTSMLVREIELKEIIERKVAYIKKDKSYQDIELKNVKNGELAAYKEIFFDIENMDEQKFIHKYVHKYIETSQRLEIYLNEEREQGSGDNNIEIEQITGYNDAIIFSLTLINPKYEFPSE